ncbi:hypothetical protein EYF80_029851 [Liparis tanakae]|uniref:Uncharacterized protein n=1 Tax=Liparis tanakae TaxID=230148 RepID=A0A4Z2H228_9TELE|nr:hypothetical protein EYF80_029851 [Liparis tanakae]
MPSSSGPVQYFSGLPSKRHSGGSEHSWALTDRMQPPAGELVCVGEDGSFKCCGVAIAARSPGNTPTICPVMAAEPECYRQEKGHSTLLPRSGEAPLV